ALQHRLARVEAKSALRLRASVALAAARAEERPDLEREVHVARQRCGCCDLPYRPGMPARVPTKWAAAQQRSGLAPPPASRQVTGSHRGNATQKENGGNKNPSWPWSGNQSFPLSTCLPLSRGRRFGPDRPRATRT